MTAARPAIEPIAVKPVANPNTGFVTVNVFNGMRELMPLETKILVTVRDGAQNQLFRDFVNSASTTFELPFHGNFADSYSIVAFAEGYEQTGFQPVNIGPNAASQLDLMLLPKEGTFHFAGARWSDLVAKKPLVAQIFEASVTGDPNAVYTDLIENHPDRLACLLNITTAMQQISLPQKSPVDYFKSFDISALAPDRIFGYADANLVKQVQLAAQHGEFDTQPAIDLTLHGDATRASSKINSARQTCRLRFTSETGEVSTVSIAFTLSPILITSKIPPLTFCWRSSPTV